jgi:hypothetical protein
VARRKISWVTHGAAYTVGGAISSVVVGYGLGAAGAAVLPPARAFAIWILLAITAVAIVRELGVVSVPLPQIRRQTASVWAKRHGLGGALLWGFDVGLVFTTWLTFAGVWVLAAAAFATADPRYGAALFLAYWTGRAISVWVAPLLVESAVATVKLLATIQGQRPLLRAIHVFGLFWALVVFAGWLAQGTG